VAHFTDENVEQVFVACSQHAAALGESLSQCFGRSLQVGVGDVGSWKPDEATADLRGPGLAMLFEVSGQAAICLLPQALDLPEWCRQPNASEQSRLDSLVADWSLQLFPGELEPTRFAVACVPDLAQFVGDCAPVDWAATLELQVMEGGAALGVILLVWPLSGPHFPWADHDEADLAKPIAPAASPPSARPLDPLARLRKIPVQLSVRLAEKRIPVSQLLTITPGALITFNKSCEDQLDLYVNNALYCRGEAVKIGEKFGLKINQVGATPQRPAKVFNG
jgi:flagellar motor switch protein FliN/FliY